MGKTRDELAALGRLLHGPIVPDWFKKICDGCSVPTGILRRALLAEQLVASCRGHDWRYYCIAIAYKPGNPLREQWRVLADYELKLNVKASFKRRWLGRMLGRFYYRGVRIGGSHALKSAEDLLHKTPPNLQALGQLCEELRSNYPDRDNNHANKILNTYGARIQRRTPSRN